ncbi:hypothetical protein BLNAU_1774 [Blattamonas nauphoetae]|uniref:Uncharacterized protein n=1 Tax=Blattamonas nauphoetae TaxID=2049346 RepID=A0ABQ9YHK3_9EUKA|nr:hypothetical protein BLNAU_1774 [Blattamonas nauphoetae]
MKLITQRRFIFTDTTIITDIRSALDIINQVQSNPPEDVLHALEYLTDATTTDSMSLELWANGTIDLLVQIIHTHFQLNVNLSLRALKALTNILANGEVRQQANISGILTVALYCASRSLNRFNELVGTCCRLLLILTLNDMHFEKMLDFHCIEFLLNVLFTYRLEQSDIITNSMFTISRLMLHEPSLLHFHQLAGLNMVLAVARHFKHSLPSLDQHIITIIQSLGSHKSTTHSVQTVPVAATVISILASATSSSPNLIELATTTLSVLASTPFMISLIGSRGGIEQLISNLQKVPDHRAAVISVLDCFHVLLSHPQTQTRFVVQNGIDAILGILKEYPTDLQVNEKALTLFSQISKEPHAMEILQGALPESSESSDDGS